jgi:hypothetical protein
MFQARVVWATVLARTPWREMVDELLVPSQSIHSTVVANRVLSSRQLKNGGVHSLAVGESWENSFCECSTNHKALVLLLSCGTRQKEPPLSRPALLRPRTLFTKTSSQYRTRSDHNLPNTTSYFVAAEQGLEGLFKLLPACVRRIYNPSQPPHRCPQPPK